MKTGTQSFTPGPWRASLQHGRTYLLDSAASGSRKNVGDIAVNNPADARLIAAAPDLLEALYRAVDDLSDYIRLGGNIGDTAVKMARAAIAKARGES